MSKILAFNWKTNPITQKDALELFNSYKDNFDKIANWEKIVFPPFVYLSQIVELAQREGIEASIGSQDISQHESGAHTSQISAKMIRDLGCGYALIGHSETRSELLTTSFDTAYKIEICLENNLKPILCVGFEPKLDNENIDFEELSDQVITAINSNETGLSKLESFIIAYEPTWAIGTGKIPTLIQIESVSDFIISTIHDHFGADLSHKTCVLYGGSVNDSNIGELAKSDKIAGFLIGGASLKPEQVKQMILKLV
jgi:triosephosphate isomerase